MPLSQRSGAVSRPRPPWSGSRPRSLPRPLLALGDRSADAHQKRPDRTREASL